MKKIELLGPTSIPAVEGFEYGCLTRQGGWLEGGSRMVVEMSVLAPPEGWAHFSC